MEMEMEQRERQTDREKWKGREGGRGGGNGNKSFIVDRLCTFSPSQIPARTHTEATPIDFQRVPVDRPPGGAAARSPRHQTGQNWSPPSKTDIGSTELVASKSCATASLNPVRFPPATPFLPSHPYLPPPTSRRHRPLPSKQTIMNE